jgi:two-component system sensor histidine kinase SenX3
VDSAVRRIGITRKRRTSRVAALDSAVDRIDGYIARSERDRAQLVAAMEAASIGMMVIDDAGVVTFVNPVAQRFIGARHGEAVAEARLREVLDDVVANREAAVQEVELYTPVRRVLFIEDLTEERRLNAVRRDFVANVGHELKTPLGALSILAETLAETDDPAVRSKLADRLVGESKRLAALVGDLLDLSQVESKGVPPEPVRVSLLVSEATGEVRLLAEDSGVELIVESVVDDAIVDGERRQLVTAITNLLDNAIKYSFPGDDGKGRVWLRTRMEGVWVEIEVEDEGIGIPESHLDRVFERFYRVDRGRSRAMGGTGLGLSIVRHVVLNHGGEVAVSSEEGVGSTFTLRLPRGKG